MKHKKNLSRQQGYSLILFQGTVQAPLSWTSLPEKEAETTIFHWYDARQPVDRISVPKSYVGSEAFIKQSKSDEF